MQKIVDSFYRRIGLFAKNRSGATRRVVHLVRLLFSPFKYRQRRKMVVNSGQFYENVSNLKFRGFLANASADFDYTKDIIALARERFGLLDKTKIELSDNQQLFTGVLQDYPLDAESPFLKFATQEKLIALVSSYFGYMPILSHLGVWYSPAITTVHTDSQLFHCDQADIKQLKVFIYCNDVSSKDGALNIIDANLSRELRKNVNYSWSDKKQCLSDELVSRYVPSNNWNTLSGPAGSIFICDTSRCFHFGSRLEEGAKERLLVAFQFVSPAAFSLPLFDGKTPSIPVVNIDNLDQVQRLLLGLGAP